MTESAPNGTYAALEQRVSGIENQIGALAGSIDSLARDVRDGRKFPWGAAATVIAATGLLGAIITFGFSAYIGQINANQTGLQGQISALTQNTMPVGQLNERYDQTERRLSTIEGGLVTRGEHESQWQNQDASVADLQRQIDLIRTDLGSSYSLNDALSALQSRLDRLESLRLDATIVPIPAR